MATTAHWYRNRLDAGRRLAVGTWYEDFYQVTDDEVLACLCQE